MKCGASPERFLGGPVGGELEFAMCVRPAEPVAGRDHFVVTASGLSVLGIGARRSWA